MTSPDPVRTNYENEMRELERLSEIAAAGPWSVAGTRRSFNEKSCIFIDAPSCSGLLVLATGDGAQALEALRDARFVVGLVNSYRSGPLSQLQADLRAAREEIAAVERALEGVEETPLARRVGHWIGVAAEETTRANAAEAELRAAREEIDRLNADRRDSAMQHIARDLSDDLQDAEVSKLRERVAKLEAQLGAPATPSGSQASPEAPTDPRPAGFDPSRRGLLPLESLSSRVTRYLLATTATMDREEDADLFPLLDWRRARYGVLRRELQSFDAARRQSTEEAAAMLMAAYPDIPCANDERAQREDPKGLSPKDASVIGEAEAPEPPLQDPKNATRQTGGQDG